MDQPLHLDRIDVAIRPWRTATLIAATVAALELALLVVLGGALLAKPDAPGQRKASPAKQALAPAGAKRQLKPSAAKTVAAELPRKRVRVVVLNGNGRQGAAAAAASRVSREGYRIGVVGNAPSHTYAASLVMYRRGFEGEGRRLARDLGVKVVGPLDGMRPAQLHGAHAVLILGA